VEVKSHYDVVILGGGHNGLVAAAYLGRAGLSVLLLEKNDYLGGATTSQRLFPDFDARISRYAYLVSLLPKKIVRDLGLKIELRARATASFTPYLRNGRHSGLLLSNVSEQTSRQSLLELTSNPAELEGMQKFYHLARVFAEQVWDTMLEPLPHKDELRRRFSIDSRRQEAWRALFEEPLGFAIERYIQDDLLRGIVFTDCKIGLFTHPHDDSLLQNRCFLYHLIGNRTGEWKVPVGGMGHVADELARVAREAGTEMLTQTKIKALHFNERTRTVEFEIGEQSHTVEAKFVLANFGPNVLAQLMGRRYEPDATHEGSVFKINMLMRRLPKLAAPNHSSSDAFCGTFHIDEGYGEMQASYRQARQSQVPDKIPCEVYCHTLTDDSILSPELRGAGYHTLTLFGLDVPWRLFVADNDSVREAVQQRCLEGLNAWLGEPIQDCLAHSRNGEPCIESKSPVDIEQALGHYRGNIFHGALAFPFAETADTTGTWGVETEYPNVFLCGASARRGGGVSGIPGHNAAMKVLVELKGGGVNR
jgi:phytoene dehydrogenase-like protein